MSFCILKANVFQNFLLTFKAKEFLKVDTFETGLAATIGNCLATGLAVSSELAPTFSGHEYIFC